MTSSSLQTKQKHFNGIDGPHKWPLWYSWLQQSLHSLSSRWIDIHLADSVGVNSSHLMVKNGAEVTGHYLLQVWKHAADKKLCYLYLAQDSVKVRQICVAGNSTGLFNCWCKSVDDYTLQYTLEQTRAIGALKCLTQSLHLLSVSLKNQKV